MKVTKQDFYMDGYLKKNLDTATYNLKNDWDFVFIITGSGMVRVGKSVLAQQIGYFVAEQMETSFSLNNIVFSGDELMKVAHSLKANSVIIYDEARAELDSKKTLDKISKKLQDFFAECGMYNHFIILVLPDFFELNKRIATTRSDALINVYRDNSPTKNKSGDDVLKYQRGYFEFYNRKQKKLLFINGKKQYDSYDIGTRYRNFIGRFTNHWVLDKDEYLKKKLEFLKRDRNKLVDEKHNYAALMFKEGLTKAQISRILGYSRARMTQILGD